ncbi:glucose-6-phosphate isomerase [Mucor velutinosus]|uniref:Glucose-6-phosphate isomerase n=1 Tax=Mucor velutinosus TaxID=708070 RepID=A0AAN7HT79_9FUNG|nr:glucose-6-phosphate isomerase [Mucor velutinosus]
MTSSSITSFFHQKPNQLTRSSTFTGNKYDANSIQRSSTLSKVKRFGSMLVRTKQQRPMIDTTSPSVRPSPSSASLMSSATANNEDSEEEEHVMTPSSSTTQFSKDVMITVVTTNTVNYQMDLDMMSVTPKDQSNQLPIMVETLEPPSSEEQVTSLTKVQTTPSSSDVFMVREQLRTMFEQIDAEIDQELESNHLLMLASIKSTPRTMY